MALSHANEVPVKILEFRPQNEPSNINSTPNQRSWNVVPLVLLIFLKHPYSLKLSITMMCSDSESRHGSLQPPWWKTTTWNLILNDPILNVLAYVLCLWHWPPHLIFFPDCKTLPLWNNCHCLSVPSGQLPKVSAKFHKNLQQKGPSKCIRIFDLE